MYYSQNFQPNVPDKSAYIDTTVEFQIPENLKCSEDDTEDEKQLKVKSAIINILRTAYRPSRFHFMALHKALCEVLNVRMSPKEVMLLFMFVRVRNKYLNASIVGNLYTQKSVIVLNEL